MKSLPEPGKSLRPGFRETIGGNFRWKGVVEDDITLEANLNTDLGADTVGLPDIALRLENAFGILIPSGELALDDMAEFDQEDNP